MAVLSVKELHQRRRSSIRDGKLTHVRVFQTKHDDIRDGTAGALFADDGTNKIPAYRELYPDSLTCRVSNIDAEPVQNSGVHFEVTVEYTGLEAVENDANPLNEPPDISWGASEGTAPYFLDQSDPPKPVTNSAGDPFEQFMERETGEMTITITRNEEAHDANAAELLSHTVNSDNVTIDGVVYPPGTLKLSPIQAAKQKAVIRVNGIEQALNYYRKTYTLKARRSGWRDKPLDVGLNELVPDPLDPTKPKRLRPIVDHAALPIKKPWPLNGEGLRKPNKTDTAAELEFRPYKEVAFAPLAFA